MKTMNSWSVPLGWLLMAPLGFFTGALVVAARLWSGA
jgi:hypothetical protein